MKMNNWNKVALSEICDLIAGFAFKSKDFGDYDSKVIKITHITPPSVDMDNLGGVDISKYNAAKLEKFIAKAGDYVLAMTGATIGKIGRIEHGSAYINQRVLLFRPRQNVDKEFLYYALQQYEFGQYITSHADSESAQPNISAGTIGKYQIILPPMEIQKRIGTLLRAYDEKRENNRKINDNFQQQLRTIFKAEFTDNPELESMTQIPLSELCHVVTKGTTPTTLGKPFVESGINFIKAESILDDHSIDKSKFAFIDEETNALLKRSIIHTGDVVFTIAGTLGRFALIDKNVLPANTNQAVAIIRADVEKVLPEYIYTCFIGEWHTDYYAKRVQQAVQANLSLTTIKSLPIPLLDEAKMSEYLSLILPLIKAIKTNEAQNEKLAALRDDLLPKLMSGEIDVSAVQL